MTEQYYFRKYELEAEYTDDERDEEEPFDQFTIRTDEVVTAKELSGIEFPDEPVLNWDRWQISKTIRRARRYGEFGHYTIDVDGDIIGWDGSDWDDNNTSEGDIVYRSDSGAIIEGEVTNVQRMDSFEYGRPIYLQVVVELQREIELAEKEIYYYARPGQFIEEIIADRNDYPRNGPQDGYWWVRDRLYTYPAPILIAPEQNYKARDEEDAEDIIPPFEFEILEREPGDDRKYHCRLRIGTRSDMEVTEYLRETKEDTENWQYYDGTSWEPFPTGGIDPNTRVRYTGFDIDDFDFGFYYWDAAAWGTEYQYGENGGPNTLISIVETDEVYKLVINGIQYNVTGLTVQESSNGEISEMNIQLINADI